MQTAMDYNHKEDQEKVYSKLSMEVLKLNSKTNGLPEKIYV